MLEKEDILKFLVSKKEELFLQFQLDKIGLFGSFSANQNTIESDIDLIVEFKPNTKNIHEKKSQLRQLISNKFDRDVDICSEKYIKPYFKSTILKSVTYV
jgi:hypothetical protein